MLRIPLLQHWFNLADNAVERYLDMKLHIGVESQSGLVHSAVVTAANAGDKRPLSDLLHGNERRVYCG